MRAPFGIIVAAALVVLPVVAASAPRTIDDCEVIEAADAYNQCLAVFGPPARPVRLGAETSGMRDLAEPAPSKAPASTQKRAPVARSAARPHAGRDQATRDHATKPRRARGEIVVQRTGRGKSLVFSVVSDRTRLR